MPYKLSATLAAHTADVRAVVSPTDSLILSASRDTTAITWTRPAPASPFAQATVFHPGTRYINAITYIPPSQDAPEGYVVTGSQDAIINVYSLAAPKEDPNFTLLGHTQNICALHAGPDGTIISGSWDQTARVWKDFQPAWELVGHSQSVWAVLAVEGDSFLTGAADNTIKLWHQHKNVKTFTGHTQAVRGLVLIPDIGFASCSNDSEIRVWTLEGDAVYTLSGHTSFVYSLAVLPNGDIVSGGEDRTVRVWRDGECAQVITHPAISVWTVSSMPNGDIVSGCSDGKVRVFSASEERWAAADELKAYEDAVASTALPAQQVGDVNKTDLPGLDALSQPGKKAGEVKMVRNGAIVEAHQWDTTTFSWQKIGDVVDAVGSGRKQLYQGKEYDYVFDVDVEEGAPPLKLPYNANENPYSAAQRFLENHELPLTYLDEVVKFIEKNVSGVNISGGNSQHVDPFTGASRYQPASTNAPSGGQDYADPFTGASRYRAPASAPAPAPASAPAPATSSYADPWTGASRYSGSTPAAPPPAPAATKSILPVSTSVSFKVANVEAMHSKLRQLNTALQQEISTSTVAMYYKEAQDVEDLFGYLSEVVAEKPVTAPIPTAKHVDTLKDLLERWPADFRFPLVDLSRLVIGYCAPAYADPGLRQGFLTALFQAAEFNEPWTPPIPKSRETNVLLLLRGLANLFQDDTAVGAAADGAWANWVMQRLSEVPYALLGKNQRVAYTTVVFNLSCVGLRERLDDGLRTLHMTLILRVLDEEKGDSESAFRALTALGNTIYAARKHAAPLGAPQLPAIRRVLGSVTGAFAEDRIRNMAGEITGLL